jgi:polysaccharide biosynthesis protein PelD
MQIDVEEQKEIRSTFLGIRQSAWLELVLCYGVLILIDLFFFEYTRYWDVNPHPFWLVTLLLACQYGTKEGLVAAVIGCLLYLIGDWPGPDQAFDQDRYNYVFSVFLQPIIWLVTAVLFGELRQRHIRERETLEQELHDSRDREDRIARAYEQVKEIKSGLEMRTATQIRSSLAAHRALRTMDVLNEAEALRGIEQLMQAVVSARKFSIFVLTENGMQARVMNGWREDDLYVRTIPANDPLYHAVLEQGRPVSVLNQDDEKLLHAQGMLAVPLKDNDTGQTFGMVKIEALPFTDLNFHTIETLLAVGELGGMTFTNLRKYEQVQAGSMVNPDYGTHSYGYLSRYIDFIRALGKRLNFDVTMLVVRLVASEQLPYATRLQASRLFAETVEQTLRKVDMTFDYQQNSEEFSIVLPATDAQGAERVREKIQSQLTKVLRGVDPNLRFSFTVEPLHAK